MEKKNIKEVSIVFECPAYSGLMRISKNWISYEEKPYEKWLGNRSWSYKHSDADYIYGERYGRLLAYVENLFGNDMPKSVSKKAETNYNIRVTYIDNTHDDLLQNGGLSENGLSGLAFHIVMMTPDDERYPEMLCIFEKKKLTKEVVKSIEPNKICAYVSYNQVFCYEEIVVAGDNGFILYSSKDEKEYPGTMDLLKGLEKYDGQFGRPYGDVMEINDEPWVFLYLGMHNFMFLDKEFAEIMNSKLFDTSLSERMGKWVRLTCRR